MFWKDSVAHTCFGKFNDIFQMNALVSARNESYQVVVPNPEPGPRPLDPAEPKEC